MLDNRVKIITLCGSSKFIDIFHSEALRLRKEGNVVLLPQLFEIYDSNNRPDGFNDDEIEKLHQIHEKKMSISDYVYIINHQGYIGKDTQREIDFCKNNGITLKYFKEEI